MIDSKSTPDGLHDEPDGTIMTYAIERTYGVRMGEDWLRIKCNRDNAKIRWFETMRASPSSPIMKRRPDPDLTIGELKRRIIELEATVRKLESEAAPVPGSRVLSSTPHNTDGLDGVLKVVFVPNVAHVDKPQGISVSFSSPMQPSMGSQFDTMARLDDLDVEGIKEAGNRAIMHAFATAWGGTLQ